MRTTSESGLGAIQGLNVQGTPAASLMAPARWVVLASLAVWSFVAYLVIVLPVDRFLPVIDNWQIAGPLALVSCALTCVIVRRLAVRAEMSGERLKDITLLFGTLLFCPLIADVGFTAYTNFNSQFRADQSRIFEQRTVDPRVWDGELMPATYYPTDANFWLYKPDQSKTATVYGEHYYSELARLPILKDSVLETRTVEFVIDRYGLRNRDDPAGSAIFALGDSFCFGYHVTQNATFPVLLKERLGEPVYNLGISGTSPLQQLLLFEYMLRTYPDSFKPKRLLWLMFEGNDLDESYRVTRPVKPTSRGLREIFAGTIVGAVADVPTLLRRQSIIRLVSSGDITFNGKVTGQSATNHYTFDGQMLAYPLYHSPRFGYAMFRQKYLDQAVQTKLDVLNHPNLSRLVDTFRRMQTLARKHEFAVTVVIVPTNVRLYKDYFEDLPPIPDRPHFSDFLKGLAGKVGFAHVDLGELLAPYAASEMIYYRDDTHWNERGHKIVADLLAHELLRSTPAHRTVRTGTQNATPAGPKSGL